MADVYRLILFTSRPGMSYPEGGSWDTGGTYDGCSYDNPSACKPEQFFHLKDAVDYAYLHHEIPVRVQSEDDVWDIIAGKLPITDNMVQPPSSDSGGGFGWFTGLDTTTLLALGAAAVFVLPRLLKKRSTV